MYLFIYKINGFIEEKNGNKYLNIAFTDNNGEVLKNIRKSWVGLRVALKKLNNNKSEEYEKD